MKLKEIKVALVALAAALALGACGALKGGVSGPKKQADAMYDAGNYAEALRLYQEMDSVSRDGVVVYRMTISSLKTENYPLAYRYSKQLNEADSVVKSGFMGLTDNFVKHQREVQIVEDDKGYFYGMLGQNYVIDKLAKYYVYCNSEKIMDLYAEMSDKDMRSEVFPTYLAQAKKVKSDDELKNICLDALKDNKDQVQALKFLGVNKYNYAEEEYKKAMNEYNKKKNSTTYAYLLRDLKIISKEYVKSKEYLEKVHKLDAEDQTTIKCLVNIYNRLDQPAKAKAYQKLLK